MSNIKKFFLMLFCSVFIMSFTSCSNNTGLQQKKENKETSKVTSYPLSFKDSYNREIKLEKEPTKIISTSPNITEIVSALDKKDKLIGRSDFCNYPADVKNISSIGGIQSPNIEKIVELKPDIVIASSLIKKEVVQKLEALNIKVAVINENDSFEGTYTTIKKVGQILNANGKAEEIVSNMEKKVASISEKVKGKNTPGIYYVIGYGKDGDFTAGKDTFISKMINMAGGKNVADDTTGWAYSVEKLIEKNPDIVICSKYMDAKSGIKNTNGYKDLPAVKNNKLYEIDNDVLDRQGPRLADGLEELAKIIHPEVFK